MDINKLEWDSSFFGKNIADLKLNDGICNFKLIDDYVSRNKIDMIQCCCNIEDLNNINELEKNGFRFIDLKVEFVLKGIENNKNAIFEILAANEDDIIELKQFSSSLFNYSRYYKSGFSNFRVNEFYELWVEKAVRGEFDDGCLKYCNDNKISGFVTFRYINDIQAQIGLFGVRKENQGNGIGYRLLSSLIKMLKEKKITTLKVVTQGNNIEAQNFYVKNGFMINNIGSWYYKFYNKY